MKRTILATFLIFPCIPALSQNKQAPRVENDTLYTNSGFKMYTGQVLKIAPGPHRYIKGMDEDNTTAFHKKIMKTMTILRMGKISVSSLNNVYISVKVRIDFPDGSSNKGNIKINFEQAINPKNGLQPELMIQ